MHFDLMFMVSYIKVILGFLETRNLCFNHHHSNGHMSEYNLLYYLMTLL